MPKRIPEGDLAAIVDSIRRHPEGAVAPEILRELEIPIPIRTLQYRLQYLASHNRLLKEGDGRGAKYRLPERHLIAGSVIASTAVPKGAVSNIGVESRVALESTDPDRQSDQPASSLNRYPRTIQPIGRRRAPVRLTSGAGFRYENMIIARFLLDMLAANNSLGDEFGRILRISCQARDAGWLVDDLALSSETFEGKSRSVGISIKSDEQVTTSGFPLDFVDVAWAQRVGRGTSRTFQPGVDAIVLICAVLDRAVSTAWSALFAEILQAEPESIVARLEPDSGEGTQSSRLQRALFDSFVRRGTQASDDRIETARLLRDIRLLDFDFNRPTSQDRGRALRACQDILTSGDAGEGRRLWERLVGIADEIRIVGGALDLRELLSKLRADFAFRDHPDFRADWDLLQRHAREAMDDVQTTIADQARLPRLTHRLNIQNRLTATGACLLVGESGSGKSALVKEIAAAGYPRVLWLTAALLDHATSVDFEHAIGLRHPLLSILRLAPTRCLVVLDGLESYSPRALKIASRLIKDLIEAGAAHIHILMTVQFGQAEKPIKQLAMQGVPAAILDATPLERPSDEEILELASALPGLGSLILRPELRSLLTNLKILDWFARTLPAGHDNQSYRGLTAIIDQLWEFWTEGPDGGFARSHLLMNIAAAEADAMTRGVPRLQIGYAEQAALPSLIRSDLIRVRDDRVSFSHDLLGDWARMRILAAENAGSTPASRDRATSPRWQQAIRLLGQRLLERSEQDRDRWQRWVEGASGAAPADELVRDLFLDGLFLAANAADLLNRNWDVLSANSGRLLNRLLHRFQFVATLPDPRLAALSEDQEALSQAEHLLRVPFWPYWGPVLTVLHARRSEVVQLAPYHAAKICALWLRSVPTTLTHGRTMPWRREAAELAIDVAREIQGRTVENRYYGGGEDRVVYEAALYAAPDFPDIAGGLCLELARRRELSPPIQARREEALQRRANEDGGGEAQRTKHGSFPSTSAMFRRKLASWPDGPRGRVERSFTEACFDPGAFGALAEAAPDIALEVLLAVSIEEPPRDDAFSRSSLPECGLSFWPGGDPPAYFRGPFLPFFRRSPQQALSFVIKLTNFGTRHYTEDRSWLDLVVEDKKCRWYGDSNVFRWHHDWPLSHGSQIQSSLMALEQWLYEQLDQGSNVEPWVGRIVAESESLAFAGLLFDVGKRAPELFQSVLTPLFSSWELWDLDFQLTMLRQSEQEPAGYWGQEAPKLFDLARIWHRLPHRGQYLLGPDGPIARTMLGYESFRAFFAEVRATWSQNLTPGDEPNHLRLLIERINPQNYTFQQSGNEIQPVDFQWPEEIERENQEQLRQINERHRTSSMPWRYRALLDARAPLTPDQSLGLWEYLQSVDAKPPEMPSESGEPLVRLEDIICGGIAVLLVTSHRWLLEDTARMDWCRRKLQSTIDHPPPRGKFHSEVSLGNLHWDSFAAESGLHLLIADPNDRLARTLVAAGLSAFNYNTTAIVMNRAAQACQRLGTSFDQMIAFSMRWAAIRPQQVRADDPKFDAERAQFTERMRQFQQAFVDGTLSPTAPNLPTLNEEARAAINAIHEKQFPGSSTRSKTRSRSAGKNHPHEVLYPERLGLDSHVMKAALGWLDVRSAASSEERTTRLKIIRQCLGLVLQSVPIADAAKGHEIDGLPSDFDHWTLQIIARAIPCLEPGEQPDELWRPLLDRGPPAHQWIERFYWHWFTDGLKNAESTMAFVAVWREMVSYALRHPAWDPSHARRFELEGLVVELLCLDQRWDVIARDEANSEFITSLTDIFDAAFQRWGMMPKVVRGFAAFAIEPGVKGLILPGILWVSAAAKEYDSYDWKYGLEESVIAFLHVCWERESLRILEDPALRGHFFALLAILVSRRSHAAIALNDRVAASTGT